MIAAPAVVETLAVVRCSFPHPRIKGELCNAKIAILTPAQLDHIKGVPLHCWRCGRDLILE